MVFYRGRFKQKKSSGQKTKEQNTLEEQLDWIEIYGLDTEQFRPPVPNNYYYYGKEGRIKNS